MFGHTLSSGAPDPFHLSVNDLIKHIYSLVTGGDTPFSIRDLPALIDAIKHQGNIGIDDRLMLLEAILHAMAVLDKKEDTRPLSQAIQRFVIGILYKDLPHPPSGFLPYRDSPSNAEPRLNIQNRGYAYRPADGSGYNIFAPFIGKTGHPYARSVPSAHATPKWALPDAGLVFDTLLKREQFVEHPGGISSLFFAFADLIIHDIFWSSGQDSTINKTSSYLDLSILYGHSEEEVASVRRFDGTGRLWDDVFADARLLLMPPSACALLVLLSRNHNYIAQKILNINERKTFQNPPPDNQEARKAQDDEIFERARLVNCGYFMHIILGDYVGAILGLVRDGSSWRLDPLMPIRDIQHDVLPRGEGNVVSVEFNLLYTWHSSLSAQDTEWIEKQFRKLFPDVDPRTLKPQDFAKAMGQRLWPKSPPKEWTFADLNRKPGPSGPFRDADLAKLLHDATDWYAGAFRARGIPDVMRVIELLNIEKARKWGTCTLNEFRKFLGLKPYSSFEEWNGGDKGVAETAARLYQHIDNLELYVGLQAEDAKKPQKGAGLCPGYTISRAILSDAVCLTRGDRFFTVDYTPANLTAWGYQDCQYDPTDGSYGGLLTKLLFRTLPDYYPPGSAYAHFPFLVPSFMRKEMIKDGRRAEAEKYTWERPPLVPSSIAVIAHEEVESILHDPAFTYNVEARFNHVFDSSSGNPVLIEELKKTNQTVFKEGVAGDFAKITLELINRGSFGLGDGSRKQVDMIRDVIKELPVLWFSKNSHVQLPKDIDFTDIGRYIYRNDDPANDWHYRSSAQEYVGRLEKLNLLSRERAIYAVAAAIPTAPYFSKALAHIVDYYLSDDKLKEREEILNLPNDSKSIVKYIKRALRHHPVNSGFYLTPNRATTVGVRVQSQQKVYISIEDANLDDDVFPTDSDVTADSPVIIGFEKSGFFTSPFFEEAISSALKVIFGLGQLRRASGDRGQCHRFTEYVMETRRTQYTNPQGQVTPWPTSMILEYQ